MPSYLNPNIIELDAIEDLAFQPIDESFAFTKVDFAITNFGTIKDFSIVVNNFEETIPNVDITYEETVPFSEDRLSDLSGNVTYIPPGYVPDTGIFDPYSNLAAADYFGGGGYPKDSSGNTLYIPYFYLAGDRDATKPPPDANNTLPNEVSFGTTDTYTEYDASGIAVVDEYTYDRREGVARDTASTISYTRAYFNKNFYLVKDSERLLRGAIYNIFVLELFSQMPNISNIDFTQDAFRSNGLFFQNDPTAETDVSGGLMSNLSTKTETGITGIKTSYEIFEYWFKQSTIWHRDYSIVQEDATGIVNFYPGDILYVLYKLKLTVSRPSVLGGGNANLASAAGALADEIPRLVTPLSSSVPLTEKNTSFILGWRIEPRTSYTVNVTFEWSDGNAHADDNLLGTMKALWDAAGIGRRNVQQILTEFIAKLYGIPYETINIITVTFASLYINFDVMTTDVYRTGDGSGQTDGQPKSWSPRLDDADVAGTNYANKDLKVLLKDAVYERALPNESLIDEFGNPVTFNDGTLANFYQVDGINQRWTVDDIPGAHDTVADAGASSTWSVVELIIEPEPEPEPEPESQPEPEPEPEYPTDITIPSESFTNGLPTHANPTAVTYEINRTSYVSDTNDPAGQDFHAILQFRLSADASGDPLIGEVLRVTDASGGELIKVYVDDDASYGRIFKFAAINSSGDDMNVFPLGGAELNSSPPPADPKTGAKVGNMNIYNDYFLVIVIPDNLEQNVTNAGSELLQGLHRRGIISILERDQSGIVTEFSYPTADILTSYTFEDGLGALGRDYRISNNIPRSDTMNFIVNPGGADFNYLRLDVHFDTYTDQYGDGISTTTTQSIFEDIQGYLKVGFEPFYYEKSNMSKDAGALSAAGGGTQGAFVHQRSTESLGDNTLTMILKFNSGSSSDRAASLINDEINTYSAVKTWFGNHKFAARYFGKPEHDDADGSAAAPSIHKNICSIRRSAGSELKSIRKNGLKPWESITQKSGINGKTDLDGFNPTGETGEAAFVDGVRLNMTTADSKIGANQWANTTDWYYGGKIHKVTTAQNGGDLADDEYAIHDYIFGPNKDKESDGTTDVDLKAPVNDDKHNAGGLTDWLTKMSAWGRMFVANNETVADDIDNTDLQWNSSTDSSIFSLSAIIGENGKITGFGCNTSHKQTYGWHTAFQRSAYFTQPHAFQDGLETDSGKVNKADDERSIFENTVPGNYGECRFLNPGFKAKDGSECDFLVDSVAQAYYPSVTINNGSDRDDNLVLAPPLFIQQRSGLVLTNEGYGGLARREQNEMYRNWFNVMNNTVNLAQVQDAAADAEPETRDSAQVSDNSSIDKIYTETLADNTDYIVVIRVGGTGKTNHDATLTKSDTENLTWSFQVYDDEGVLKLQSHVEDGWTDDISGNGVAVCGPQKLMVPSKERVSVPDDLVDAFVEEIDGENFRLVHGADYNPGMSNPARSVHAGAGVDPSTDALTLEADAGYNAPPIIGYGFPEFIPCNEYDIIINNGNLNTLTDKDMMLDDTTNTSLNANGASGSADLHVYGADPSETGKPDFNYSSDDRDFSNAVSSAPANWWKSDNIGVTYKNLEVFDNNLTDEQVSDFITKKLT